jgi:hypothetical protein
MSSRNISQTEAVSALSLADLLARVAASDLPERKRQELSSAIRTVARALGRAPENVPADGRLLAGRLKDVAPAAIGISRGRWANIRRLLRTALALVQPISPGRHQNGLLPEWLVLRNELTSRSDKIALSRLLHFCSVRGITPNAVTKETFADYHPSSRTLAVEKAGSDIHDDRKGVAAGGRRDPWLAKNWDLGP